MAPGGAGSLTLIGNLQTTGVLNLEIGGTTAGSTYDQLIVNGSATLGGTLNVSLINGFTTVNGQTFSILTSSLARSGVFGTTTLPAGTSVQYNPNSIALTVP